MTATQDIKNENLPYQLPMPKDAPLEIVIPSAVPEDDRLWVKQVENVFFRPLCLNISQGYLMNLLKVTKSVYYLVTVILMQYMVLFSRADGII